MLDEGPCKAIGSANYRSVTWLVKEPGNSKYFKEILLLF